MNDKILKEPMNLPIIRSKYECEGCTACCDTLGIEELCKPYFTPCEHNSGNGCRIHGSHPKSCNEYLCLWKLGQAGEIGDRPDKSGFLLFPCLSEMSGKLNQCYLDIYETRPIESTQANLDKVLVLVNAVLAKVPKFDGVRYHRYGNKIGVPWVIDPKYPQGTHDIGNCFIEDPDSEGLFWHVNPKR